MCSMVWLRVGVRIRVRPGRADESARSGSRRGAGERSRRQERREERGERTSRGEERMGWEAISSQKSSERPF
jgi:hypothetical protein